MVNTECDALILLCANLINADIKFDARVENDGICIFGGEGKGAFKASPSDELVSLSVGGEEAVITGHHEALAEIARCLCVPIKREDEYVELSDTVKREVVELLDALSDKKAEDFVDITENAEGCITSNGVEEIPAGGFDCTEDLEFIINYIGISYEEIADESGEPSFSRFYSFIEKKRTEIEARLDDGVSGLPFDEMEDILRFMKYADGFAGMLAGMSEGGSEEE